MSEQAIEEQEEKQEAQEEKQEEQEEEKKYEGDSHVDLDAETAEVKARFNRMYGTMKRYERENGQLLQDQQQLAQNVETLQGQLETLVQDSTEQRLSGLRAEKAVAYEAGEIEKVLELDEQMIEEREKAKEKPEEKPAESKQPEGLPDHINQAIQAWSDELDENDNYLRPWAHTSHPKFQSAIPIAQGVLNDPAMMGADTVDILQEIDNRVKSALFPQKVKRTNSVLSADNEVTPKPGTQTKLNDDQKFVARKMYPKISQKDAEARYAKALQA